ncbi:MAG: ribosome small subunit-dependent GTPase A [Colwelliaceae bacterium]|nr:ribosome small subunit-dependent GTPase A [Colwelliaceae bacterium]
MKQDTPTLIQLGWKPYFQQQLSLEEFTDLHIGRITEQHRNSLIVICEQGQLNLTMPPNGERICVGDWVLFDDENRLIRPLERQSLFERKAPGTQVNTQLIAANIDTLIIVCSLNQDFNLNRIERYLAIANEARVESIIVLTKADQCLDVDDKRQQVQRLDPLMMVHALNALEQDELKSLEFYCQTGKTIAFLGSSGVGKSTLVNGLLGFKAIETGAIREDDSKGRHTTTYRTLKVLPQGGILMDTPGMRQIQLSDCEQGVNETFNEIIELASQCRFNDCEHISEPGCMVQSALEKGELEHRRFESYQKLIKEQAFNSASLAEKKAKDKALGKMINRTLTESKQFKRGQ